MEKIKGAIEKARLAASQGDVLQENRQIKAQRPVIKTAVPVKEIQSTASFETDVDKIDYDKTKVVQLDLNHLDKNRIIALNERDPRTSIFDSLRTQVIQKMEENNWRTLAIISPTPGCGKTSIAINLAISIAEQPQKTAILVDFDLRRPRIASYLGLKVEKSMNDFLHDNAELQDILVNPSVPRLVVLPTNRPVNKSSEMLASSKISNLIKELKGRYDSRIVIIDLPPMLNSDDAMVVLQQVDCALMVVGNGLVNEADINESMRLLAKTNLLGIVINKAEDVQVRDYY
jgi:capsular exopolysaccharide synthesis family protein